MLGYQQWRQHQGIRNDAAGRYQELIELAAIDFSNEDTDADLGVYSRSLMACDRLTQTAIMQRSGPALSLRKRLNVVILIWR